MAQQTINVGTAPNDGTGTPLRTAFQYTNSNFTELYTATGPSGNNINVPGAATITGNLTVDTNTFFVDSANNRVGVGTATPSAALDVNGASNLNGNITIANTGSPFGTVFVTGSALELQANSNATNGLSLKTTSTTPIVFSVNSSEAMRLNSTGLGVGVSPSYKLDINGVINTNSEIYATGGRLALYRTAGASYLDHASGQDLIFRTVTSAGGAGPSELMRLNSTGLGIGVTPSAWNTIGPVLQIEQASLVSESSNQLYLSANAYFASGNWNYINNSQASQYYQSAGSHVWRSATASTGAISFSTLMTLDANGNLILQSSATPATLTTNGQLTVNATSNTNLRFSYRGSDGVTRVANITLA